MTMSILNANTTNNHCEHLHLHHHQDQHHHLCVQPEIPDVVTWEGLVRVSGNFEMEHEFPV